MGRGEVVDAACFRAGSLEGLVAGPVTVLCIPHKPLKIFTKIFNGSGQPL
jgi:hypothetical protein